MIERFRGEHHFLSNFYPARICIAQIAFPTVEHAYVAAKLPLDLPNRWHRQAAIALVPFPGQAKRLGARSPLRKDWMEMRLELMHRLLRLKFAHPELAAKLVATDPQELVEGNDWNDRFWGVCRGEGHNHLGRLLMEVRASLRVA